MQTGSRVLTIYPLTKTETTLEVPGEITLDMEDPQTFIYSYGKLKTLSVSFPESVAVNGRLNQTESEALMEIFEELTEIKWKGFDLVTQRPTLERVNGYVSMVNIIERFVSESLDGFSSDDARFGVMNFMYIVTQAAMKIALALHSVAAGLEHHRTTEADHERISKLEEDMAAQILTVNHQIEELQELRKSLSDEQTTVGTLRADNQQLNTQIENQTSILGQRDATIADLNNQVQTQAADLAQSNATVDDLTTRVQVQTGTLTQNAARITELETNNQSLNSQLEAQLKTNSESLSRIAELEASAQSLTAVQTDLSNQLQEVRAREESLQKQVNELQANYNQAVDEKDTALRRLEEVRKELAEVQQARSTLQGTADTNAAEQRRVIESLRKNLSDANSVRKNLMEELERAQKSGTQTSNEKEALEQQVQISSSRISELEKRLKETSDLQSRTSQSYLELTAQVEESKKRLEDSEAQVQSLNKQLNESRSLYTGAVTRSSVLEKQLNESTQSLARIHTQLEQEQKKFSTAAKERDEAVYARKAAEEHKERVMKTLAESSSNIQQSLEEAGGAMASASSEISGYMFNNEELSNLQGKIRESIRQLNADFQNLAVVRAEAQINDMPDALQKAIEEQQDGITEKVKAAGELLEAFSTACKLRTFSYAKEAYSAFADVMEYKVQQLEDAIANADYTNPQQVKAMNEERSVKRTLALSYRKEEEKAQNQLVRLAGSLDTSEVRIMLAPLKTFMLTVLNSGEHFKQIVAQMNEFDANDFKLALEQSVRTYLIYQADERKNYLKAVMSNLYNLFQNLKNYVIPMLYEEQGDELLRTIDELFQAVNQQTLDPSFLQSKIVALDAILKVQNIEKVFRRSDFKEKTMKGIAEIRKQIVQPGPEVTEIENTKRDIQTTLAKFNYVIDGSQEVTFYRGLVNAVRGVSQRINQFELEIQKNKRAQEIVKDGLAQMIGGLRQSLESVTKATTKPWGLLISDLKVEMGDVVENYGNFGIEAVKKYIDDLNAYLKSLTFLDNAQKDALKQILGIQADGDLTGVMLYTGITDIANKYREVLGVLENEGASMVHNYVLLCKMLSNKLNPTVNVMYKNQALANKAVSNFVQASLPLVISTPQSQLQIAQEEFQEIYRKFSANDPNVIFQNNATLEELAELFKTTFKFVHLAAVSKEQFIEELSEVMGEETVDIIRSEVPLEDYVTGDGLSEDTEIPTTSEILRRLEGTNVVGRRLVPNWFTEPLAFPNDIKHYANQCLRVAKNRIPEVVRFAFRFVDSEEAYEQILNSRKRYYQEGLDQDGLSEVFFELAETSVQLSDLCTAKMEDFSNCYFKVYQDKTWDDKPFTIVFLNIPGSQYLYFTDIEKDPYFLWPSVIDKLLYFDLFASWQMSKNVEGAGLNDIHYTNSPFYQVPRVVRVYEDPNQIMDLACYHQGSNPESNFAELRVTTKGNIPTERTFGQINIDEILMLPELPGSVFYSGNPVDVKMQMFVPFSMPEAKNFAKPENFAPIQMCSLPNDLQGRNFGFYLPMFMEVGQGPKIALQPIPAARKKDKSITYSTYLHMPECWTNYYAFNYSKLHSEGYGKPLVAVFFMGPVTHRHNLGLEELQSFRAFGGPIYLSPNSYSPNTLGLCTLQRSILAPGTSFPSVSTATAYLQNKDKRPS